MMEMLIESDRFNSSQRLFEQEKKKILQRGCFSNVEILEISEKFINKITHNRIETQKQKTETPHCTEQHNKIFTQKDKINLVLVKKVLVKSR